MSVFVKGICEICWTLDFQLEGMERRLERVTGAFGPFKHFKVRQCDRIDDQQGRKARIHPWGVVWFYGD